MWFDVSFGAGQAGLGTVGYRQYNAAGGDAVARTTTGVVEIGNGAYGVEVTPDSAATGIEWDTGGASPVYAHENILESVNLAEDAAFLFGRVWIDVSGGSAGTAFPLGTPGDPVDNLADAQSIIAARGMANRLYLIGTLPVGGAESVSGFDILGAGKEISAITFTAGATTVDTRIEGCNVLGTAAGAMTLLNGSIDGLTAFSGFAENCGLDNTITLAGDTDFSDCYSEIAGTGTPIIDANGIANILVIVRDHDGGIRLLNLSGAGNPRVSFDLNSGAVRLDVTNTTGVIVVRGVLDLTDNSAGSTVVIDGATIGQRITELWELQGLDINNPMTVTPTSRDASADVSQTISGDGVTTTTVTRDP